MFDPIGSDATGPDDGPLTTGKWIGIVLAFLLFVAIFVYLFSIA